MEETVGIAAISYYLPSGIMTSEAIAKLANIPPWVLTEKIGMEKNCLKTQNHLFRVQNHSSTLLGIVIKLSLLVNHLGVLGRGFDPRHCHS